MQPNFHPKIIMFRSLFKNSRNMNLGNLWNLMEGRDRKQSEVALHIYKDIFTYSARNNWILKETRDSGSKGPEPSSDQTFYAAVYQEKGQVHYFSICMQTEQLVFVNSNILNICKTRCIETFKRWKSLNNILHCSWKKVKIYSTSDCKRMQKLNTLLHK